MSGSFVFLSGGAVRASASLLRALTSVNDAVLHQVGTYIIPQHDLENNRKRAANHISGSLKFFLGGAVRASTSLFRTGNFND